MSEIDKTALIAAVDELHKVLWHPEAKDIRDRLRSLLNVEPIEIGAGKVQVGLVFDPQDERETLRELAIMDMNHTGELGAYTERWKGQSIVDAGTVLARIRIVNADGAFVLMEELQKAINNARAADEGSTGR